MLEKWRNQPNNAVDEKLIAEAIAAGKLRRIPAGMTSEWENMSFKERRTKMLGMGKKRQRQRLDAEQRVDVIYLPLRG